MTRPRLLFLVTEDWYFMSHRLHLALAAKAAGYEVAVATRLSSHGDALHSAGVTVLPFAMGRRAGNPLVELWSLVSLLRSWRPDILHTVALKPAVLGSAAALLAGVPSVVNAVSGMGYVYINQTIRARLLRPLLTAALRLLIGRRRCHLIVQNVDDRAFFVDGGLVPGARVHLIRGSGVDVTRFTAMPEPEGTAVAALVARLLWDKGVGELVEAARLLRARNIPLRVALVGRPDPANPRSIPEETVRRWVAEGVVEWWGHSDDVAEVWRRAAIAVLPSYREGLPKALLEAAACGRPAVTTDVPGCREVVADGDNGLLVPVRSVEPLADALARLAGDAVLRRTLGERGRQRAEEEFSESRVAKETLDVYDRLRLR
ncbi:MAG: glycosyltransferase family 4 protein [Pseudomonadota bacterium]